MHAKNISRYSLFEKIKQKYFRSALKYLLFDDGIFIEKKFNLYVFKTRLCLGFADDLFFRFKYC